MHGVHPLSPKSGAKVGIKDGLTKDLMIKRVFFMFIVGTLKRIS